MEVLSISLGRGILEQGSRERARMHEYALRLDALHIIVLTRKEHGYTDVQSEGTLNVYPTNSYSRLGMLIDAYRIGRRLVKQNRTSPLIVSAQDPLEIGWMSWLLARHQNTRFHVQVHGDYFGAAWVGRSPVRLVKRYFACLLLRRAPSIRVVSERIKMSLVVRGIAEKKITVLPIRPELESFLSYTAVPDASRPLTYLFVGRLAPEKNISRIIRAFEKVYAENKNVRLTIVGSGGEESSLKACADNLGISDGITWIPWTPNVGEEMARADVFVLASKHEAYGLVLLEAMAVGLPIITTDVGCIGEVCVDQKHGIVVYKNDDATLADAMKRMQTDAEFRGLCGQQGKKTARKIAETSSGTYVDAWVSALRASED